MTWNDFILILVDIYVILFNDFHRLTDLLFQNV